MKKLFITYNEQRLAKEGDSIHNTVNVIQVNKSNLYVEQRFVSGKPNLQKIVDCKVYKVIDDVVAGVGFYKADKGFVKSSLWQQGKSIYDKN
jgi:hypothetical protein